MNLTTGEPFHDGAHILYVNGEYRGDSDIGKLMHDFNCTDADEMNIELLAQGTRYLKESPEGVSEMCREMEIMRDKSHAEGRAEGRAEGLAEGKLEERRENAISLHRLGLDVDFIANALKAPVETVKQWIASELQ